MKPVRRVVRNVTQGTSRGAHARSGGRGVRLFGSVLGATTLLAGVGLPAWATAAALTPMLAPTAKGAAVFTRPTTGSFIVDGRAYGHAIGMSQIGAVGAARLGIGAPAILAHYYPGTSLTKRADVPFRVWLQAAGGCLTVTATPGLRMGNLTGIAVTLPSGPVAWRLTALSDGRLTLSSLATRTSKWVSATIKMASVAAGTTTTTTSTLGPTLVAGTSFLPALPKTIGAAVVRGLTGVRVENIDGSTTTEPGSVTVMREHPTLAYTVVILTIPMDTYVRGVVGQEIGSGSPAAAQQAQAIAARTYAARSGVDGAAAGRPFDICDTTQCQAFTGIASGTVGSGPAADQGRYYAASDAAVAATAAQILTYKGAPINAMFGASNGGFTRSGGQPYLPAAPDPWDGLTGSRSHAWTAILPASAIEAGWPTLGKLTRLQVASRDGHGDLGGRSSVVLLDFCTSKACTQVQTTPRTVGSLYAWPNNVNGLRSSWWLPQGATISAPAPTSTPSPTPTSTPSATPTAKPTVLPAVSLLRVQAAANRDPSLPDGQFTAKTDVIQVQRGLVAEHLLVASGVDGSFGPITMKAFSAWRVRLGYTPGPPGPLSLTALGTKYGFKVTP